MRPHPRPGIKPGVFRSMLRWSRGDGRRARGSVAGNEDDQARFRRVVLPHLSDAYALARWIVGNATDAEDVVQDACLRAFRGINGFAGGNARAWLLTVTRHAAFTWLGKNRPAVGRVPTRIWSSVSRIRRNGCPTQRYLRRPTCRLVI